jgi:hypothetical protein
MGQYRIKIEPSTLPDSTGKKDVVLVAIEGGSRNGERLGVGKYYVTVIDDDGFRYPGQVLSVDTREDQYVFGLGSTNEDIMPVTKDGLSGLTFEFMSTKVTP